MIRLAIRALNPTQCWRPYFPRTFHTSPQKEAWFLLGPILRGTVAVAARLTRRWWVKLSPERRGVFKATLYRRRYYFYGGVCGLAAIGGLYYWSHLEATPYTGRQRFVIFSKADLTELIELEKEELFSLLIQGCRVLPKTHPHTQKVVSILEHIIVSNWSPYFEGLNWTVYVIDNPGMINAVCLPNGHVFVFTGLLDACQNTDQLAFILGHEIAHTVLGHGAEGLSHTGLVEFAALLLVGLVWAVVPNDLIAYFMHSFSRSTAHVLLDYPYSRTLETEADNVGLMFAAKACYDPARGAEVWKHLPSEEGAIQYLSTHPTHEIRLENLNALLPVAHQLREESQCRGTEKEVKHFQAMLNRTLKKLISW